VILISSCCAEKALARRRVTRLLSRLRSYCMVLASMKRLASPKPVRTRIRTILLRLVSFLGLTALQNALALLALVVALISLWITLADRRELQNREFLSATMTSDVIGEKPASIEFSERNSSPFDPPYLMIPLRIFVMNGSSMPLSVIGLWVTFDEAPENQLRFITLDQVTEPSGDRVAWPKTITPGQATGFDVIVPVPVDAEVARRLGADPEKQPKVDLGPARDLFFKFSDASTYKQLKRRVRFDLRLLSPSPGHPRHLPYTLTLP
jgi:hypothetical protein